MFEQLDQRSCIAFFASTEEALFLICEVSRRVNYARLRGSPDRKTLEKLHA
jgi:hypothetical protein